MKIICPACSLKGTVSSENYQKRVKCPECHKVFRITDEELFRKPEQSGGIYQRSLRENGSLSVTSAGMAEKQDIWVDQSIVTCSKCGFQLSGRFIKTVENQPVCTACSG